MKKKYLDLKIGSLFKASIRIIIAVIVIVAVSAVFQACEKRRERKHKEKMKELEIKSATESPSSKIAISEDVQITKNLKGGWMQLDAGVDTIKVPPMLIMRIVTPPDGEEEQDNVPLEYKHGAEWKVYYPNGSIQSLGENNIILLRVAKPTKIWVRYFYKKENEGFVKANYKVS